MNKFTGTTTTTIYILYIILEIQRVDKDVDRKNFLTAMQYG